MLNCKTFSATVFLLLFVVLIGACKKKEVCEPQSFELQSYICFKQADTSYIIQNQAELDNFLNETSSDIADCMPPPFNVDFNTQTILAYYTTNCENTLELCLDDTNERWYYTIQNTNSECGPVQRYNVITVSKINNSQLVVFVRN